MSTVHIMIDIETLGQSTRAPILSIGAVASDGREPFYRSVTPILEPPFVPDWPTIKWWLTQPDAARSSLVDASAIYINHALLDLVDWLAMDDRTLLWAKPPRFDIAILEHAYRAGHIVMPWASYHRQVLDLRTIARLRDPSGDVAVKVPTVSVRHNALDDARWQLDYLLALHPDDLLGPGAAAEVSDLIDEADRLAFEANCSTCDYTTQRERVLPLLPKD